MKTPKEYHYTYYSYEEWGRGYFGSRTCKCLPEEDIKYFGSFKDKTFKPTEKIILKSDYATRTEAIADEIILQEYYKVVENPHFANRAYQTTTKFYYITPTEKAIENGKLGGQKSKELCLGIHALTFEQRSNNSKKAQEVAKDNGTGVYGLTKEQKSKGGKIVGQKNKELQRGIFTMTTEELSVAGKLGGKRAKELKSGFHGRTKEQMSEDGKKVSKSTRIRAGKTTGSQRWMCNETGFITTPGALTHYQRAKGIDTSKRTRVL
jgi:hypothetical protein